MLWFRVLFVVVLAGQLVGSDSFPADPDRTEASAASSVAPPVLRSSEPRDSGLVRLPGPARILPQAPTSRPATVAPKPVNASVTRAASPTVETAFLPAKTETASKTALKSPSKPVFPPEFERDSAVFCQRMIGQWNQADVYNLFGNPLRGRAAFDEDRKENGRIYAYADPSGHYRELELDFSADTGLLRTVFVYPWKLQWDECRKVWGSNVAATDAPKGRKFYSYLNRRLDVLVDATGRVISLGLY